MNAPTPQLNPVATSFSTFPVPLEHVNDGWSRTKHLLLPAIERSGERWKPEHLYHALATGQQQLWVVAAEPDLSVVGALTTQIVQYPGCKMLAYQFLGGSGFEDWMKGMNDTVSEYAKHCGCAGTEAVARFGFKPMLAKLGYRAGYLIYDRYFEDTHDV